MNSFGIWAKYKADIEDKKAVDVHANLWDIGKNSESAFFDFGLMIPGYKSLEVIKIALPFFVDNDHIEDLSDIIHEEKIGSLVFNTVCIAHSVSRAGSYAIKSLSLDNSDRHILLLPIADRSAYYGIVVKIEKVENLTCIRIDFSGLREECKNYEKLYLRFRIRDRKIKDAMFCKLKKKNYFLESAFTETKIVDFMVNELRSIKTEVNEEMTNQKLELVELSKVHFFVMEPAEREVSSDKMECRRLEPGWDKYINQSYTSDTLVYHWSKRAKDNQNLSNYSELVKVTSAETNWRLILCYVLVCVILSIASNFLYENLANIFSILKQIIY